MGYDDWRQTEPDYDYAPRPNCTCPCGREFYKGRGDDGQLCDTCCDRRDAARTRRENNQAIYLRAVTNWFRSEERKASRG